VNTGGSRANDSADDRFDEARAADQPDPDDPEAPLYTSTELEDENGEPYVIQQQNVGPGRELGGGEWPDPDTPPRPPAPGSR
jgi:hypothetical protein